MDDGDGFDSISESFVIRIRGRHHRIERFSMYTQAIVVVHVRGTSDRLLGQFRTTVS